MVISLNEVETCNYEIKAVSPLVCQIDPSERESDLMENSEEEGGEIEREENEVEEMENEGERTNEFDYEMDQEFHPNRREDLSRDTDNS